RDHEVGRFEVAMHDAVFVGMLQGGADLPAQIRYLFPRQAAASLQGLIQRLPLHVFHGIKGGALKTAADVEADDVRMAELLEDFCFTLKTCQSCLVVSEPKRHDLEGYALAALV